MSLESATAPPSTPSGVLGRLARVTFRRRRLVIVAWLAAFAVAFGLSAAFGGEFSADYGAPGSDSAQAQSILHASGLTSDKQSLTFVVHGDQPLAQPAAAQRLNELMTSASRVPHVRSVTDLPHAQVSPDGRTALLEVGLDVTSENDMPVADTKALIQLAHTTSTAGLTVAPTGKVVGLADKAPIGSEGIGLLAAALILILLFGSVVAAGLPIVVAVAGIAVTSALTGLLAALMPVPEWSTALATMMGLGVGIDYALLMVTRFRDFRSKGLGTEDATVATLDTAGRSVVLAGATVIISMLGLFAMGLSFMRGAALVTIAGVLVVLLAATTLFPALLGFLGSRVDRWRIPLPRRSKAIEGAGWLRWSRFVQKYRIASTVVGLGLMAALTAPFLNVDYGFPDAGNDAKGTSSRAAYDATVAGFGPGAAGPLLIAINGADHATLTRVVTTLRSTPGIASATDAVVTAGGSAIVTAQPTTGPQAKATADLVRRLREKILPPTVAGTSAAVHVGGSTAVDIDSTANIVRRLPLLIGGVVGLSMLLLLVAFRSIAVAVKAAAMNLLSVGASYGVVAYFMQGGWAGRLVGINAPTPLFAFVPVLMFAILFGLSMDYEVFLVTRMRDAWKQTGNNAHSIVSGLASTARVITAAAAIMIVVFSAFVPSTDIAVKIIGIGMVAAILIDATLVRMLLVPAVMHLLGDRNWWLPTWLDRRLPELSVEGHEEHYLPAPLPVERELAPAL